MAHGTYAEVLSHRGFRAFLWAQFLGAFNDNVCKFVVSIMAVTLAAGRGPGALPLVGAAFILPYLLFSGYAGQLADVHSKRTVLVATKAFEVAAMALGVLAFAAGRLDWLLVVLFLMTTQSTFFGPAKYGIVPELMPDAALSRANGLLEMSTFLAIILGTSVGGFLSAVWDDHPSTIGLVLLAIAVVGTVASLGIPRVPAVGGADAARLRWAPWAGLEGGLRRVLADRDLALTVTGIAFFWFLAALVQMLVLLLGAGAMALDHARVGLLGTFLAIGIAAGSLAAGRLSGEKVELGLVPLGSFLMGACATGLAFVVPSYALVSGALVLLGAAGGLFIVPLQALLQQRPAATARGQVIAVGNLASTLGILAASGALWLLGTRLALPPERLVLGAGLFTLAASVYVLWILPHFLIRFVLWLLAHTVYRIRVEGQAHVPFRGPALLVCNHVSHVDAFLVGACVQRFIRFLIYRPYYELPVARPLLDVMRAIPVQAGDRTGVTEAIDRARRELADGHVVCIFAEGAITRTGRLRPFKRGVERILEGLDVPVIPVHLDRLWGSIFSYKHGRFFWKLPERLPYPVTVTFGAPLAATVTALDLRQAIQELGSEAVAHRFGPADLLHHRAVRTMRRRWRHLAMADASGREMTFGRVLVGALLLARWLRRACAGQRMVGILLPASVGGALANVAVMLAGKVPVNLNFTAGAEAMAHAMDRCGIRTVVTSKAFVSKGKIDPPEGSRYLEDVLPAFGAAAKLRALLAARLLPFALLRRRWFPEPATPADVATVIFSSGSTGVPKGVMLSHMNVLSNLEGMGQVFWVTRQDRLLAGLPFFHSFGFTGSLWFPLTLGFPTLFVPNPMDAKAVGEMAEKYGATLLIGTPTFYQAYLRKVTPAQFASLRHAIVGAERLREPIARAFRERYGLELLEGYGCTEMSPVISVNTPDLDERQRGFKPGTVGPPLPGVAVRVVHPETGAPLPAGAAGLLLVKGPNRMIGYLDEPDRTRDVVRDGWYVTGDIAEVDEDGFIRLTDRLSRFSKIAGEMVPHLRVEEVAADLLGEADCVVTSVPDESRGERLVLFYTGEMGADEVWAGLSRSALPKLWIPKRDDVRRVDAIPVLGTGKVDLRAVRQLAQEAARRTAS